jgi:hypothetical protein
MLGRELPPLGSEGMEMRLEAVFPSENLNAEYCMESCSFSRSMSYDHKK